MSVQCSLKEMPAQPALVVRTVTSVDKLPQELGRAYGAIMQLLGEQGRPPAGMPYCAYFNMDMQNLEVEMGFPVDQIPASLGVQAGDVPVGDVQAGEIPAGKYATCVHLGPYQEMVATYEALNRWIAENGYTASGTAYEFYYNDPAEVPPEEIKTEIWLALQED